MNMVKHQTSHKYDILEITKKKRKRHGSVFSKSMFTNTHTYTHTASWDPATVLHAVCNHPTGMVHTVQGDPPPMWGPQSDAIGAAVVTLLQRDPRKFDQVL